jgi:hypothetical protein
VAGPLILEHLEFGPGTPIRDYISAFKRPISSYGAACYFSASDYPVVEGVGHLEGQ